VAIAVESLVFLASGIILAVLLWQVLGRPKPAPPQGAPVVKLVRTPRAADGHEETILTLNDRAILTVSNEDVRLSEFADRLEQLEAVATRIAAALGVSVEFTRIGPQAPQDAGIPMSTLPLTTDAEIEDADARTRRSASNRGQGAA
jgi:hypothetical protein